jgi:YD repeat-containing protein
MNKTKTTGGRGNTRTMTYDELGRAASVTFNYGSFAKTLTDTHDAANREWQITDPEGRVTSYMHDRDSCT